MDWIWIIAFIAVLIIGCICVYKSAEVHELHKIRAAFEDKKHEIEQIMNSDDVYTVKLREAEINEINELEKIIDIEIDHLKLYDLRRFGID